MSISSYHSIQTVQETVFNQNHVCYESTWLMGIHLHVLEYTYHRLFFPPKDSSVWNFPQPLHLTMSLLQLLKGTDNL